MAEFPSLQEPELSIVDDALEVLARSSAAAFAIDRSEKIIYWNEGAERILGWSADEMLGKLCFEALDGHDPFGNLYCTAQCPIVVAATKGEAPEPYLMQVRDREKGVRTIRVRAVPLPEPGEAFRCLMHLIEPQDGLDAAALVAQLKAAASGTAHSKPAPDPILSVNPLTPREREIVLLLSNGYAALNIAAKLNLSHATVRNHIQNVLRKLEVHSQVEAIAVAFRRGWI
jgi:DNA-binding CsgD family transcriptional regulator